jgi:hypothetical protein
MDGFEVTGPYVSALLMSLGALCVFVWGVLSGAFHRADEASVRFCEMEMESDANSEHAKQTCEMEMESDANSEHAKRTDE